MCLRLPVSEFKYVWDKTRLWEKFNRNVKILCLMIFTLVDHNIHFFVKLYILRVLKNIIKPVPHFNFIKFSNPIIGFIGCWYKNKILNFKTTVSDRNKSNLISIKNCQFVLYCYIYIRSAFKNRPNSQNLLIDKKQQIYSVFTMAANLYNYFVRYNSK